MQNLTRLTWRDLFKAKYPCITPFQIDLGDNQVFIGERVLRMTPKRRLVVFGMWQNKPVVAKLFFNPKRAKLHYKKECDGIKLLVHKGILTPELYKDGTCGKIYYILLERIFNSETLYTIWRNKKCVEEILPLLESVINELANQHSIGILQRDMKLQNILIYENQIHTIGGDDIESFPMALARDVSINNIAMFFSELGVELNEYKHVLFHHYMKLRGWPCKKMDISELDSLITLFNQKRWERYGGKLFVERSRFFCIRDWSTFGMADRNYAFPEFIEFLKDPELGLSQPSAIVLKADSMTKLVKVTLDQRDFIVKCYQVKNIWESMQPTVAASLWKLANKLNYFGIPTPTPVAFIEKKIFGICKKTYYITEYISGEHVNEYFNRHHLEEDKMTNMKDYIDLILKNISLLGTEKHTINQENILIDNFERPVVLIE